MRKRLDKRGGIVYNIRKFFFQNNTENNGVSHDKDFY